MLIGKNIKEYVEKLLIEDLKNHGVSNLSGLTIDWSGAVGEGGGTTYKNEYVEHASDVVVKDKDNKDVFSGWTDYFVDASGKLHAYWTILDKLPTGQDYDFKKLKGNGFGIPDYIWRTLTEDDKIHIAKTRQGWHSDSNLMSYRIKVIPELIKEGISEYEKFDIKELKDMNTRIDIDLLVSEMNKYIKYSEKVLNKEETKASELLTYTHKVYSEVTDLEKTGSKEGKKIKHFYDVVNTFWFIVTHAELIYRINKKKKPFKKVLAGLAVVLVLYFVYSAATYKSPTYESEISKLPGVDMSTLEELYMSGGTAYFKDKNNVYLGFSGKGTMVEKIKNADPETFEVLDSCYAKDKNNVYCTSQIVMNADPNSFELLDYDYAKDANSVFQGLAVYKEVDPETFQIMNYYYVKDKDNVFYQDHHDYKMIDGADPVSFNVMNSNFAKDDMNVYFKGELLEGADVQTFVASDNGWDAEDVNFKYNGTERIKK